MKRYICTLLAVLMTAGLLGACAEAPIEEPTAIPEPSITPFVHTATPRPPTPIPQPSPTAFIPITGKVDVFSLNMRSGPSTVHGVVEVFSQGTGLKIVGKASGDEWVFVEVAGAEPGWMYVPLLEMDEDLSVIPVTNPEGSLLVVGRVEGSDGKPVGDIKVAIFQGIGETERRTETITGPDGNFYIYLPETSQGEWTVQVVGYRCSSRIVEQNCQFSGFFRDNGVAVLELPQATPVVFVYEFPEAE